MPLLVRRVQEASPEQAPISAPDPLTAQLTVDPGPVTRREWTGYAVWGVLAVIVTVFELLAFLDADMPFPTLSETAGNLQARHNWTAMPILGGLAVLGARIVFYPWPFKKAES